MEPTDQRESSLVDTTEVFDPVPLMWGLFVVSLVLFVVGLALHGENVAAAAMCWAVAQVLFGVSVAWLVIRSAVAAAIRSTRAPGSTSRASEPKPKPEPEPESESESEKSERADAARGVVREMRAQGHSRSHIEDALVERGFTRDEIWDVLDR